jgi:drug/metabolite transporter (DMT)-like permease
MKSARSAHLSIATTLSLAPTLIQPTSRATAWGIAYTVLAALCFSVLDTTSQLIGLAAPIVMAQWLRYGVQVVSSGMVMATTGELAHLRITRPRLHIARGLLMVCTTMLGFGSLRYVPVADFTAIVMLTPLLITLMSAWFLREKVSGLRWMLAAGGFAGVLIIIRPGSHTFEPAYLLVLLLAVVGAAFQVLTAWMMRTESSSQTHLASGVIGFLVMSAALPFFWQALPLRIWGLMLIVGLSASTGHLLLVMALKKAHASVVTPFIYTQLAFAVMGGWLMFGRVPDGWSFLGMVVIAMCGIANAWLSMRESRQASAAVATV